MGRVTALGLAGGALALVGCGGSQTPGRTVTVTRPTGPPPRVTARPVPGSTVLVVAGGGRLLGACPARGPFALTLTAEASGATNDIAYRVGGGRTRSGHADPGAPLRIAVPVMTIRRPSGDALRASPPLQLRISQATEPETITVSGRLQLVASGRIAGQCVLVGTDVRSRVEPHDGGPPL